MKKSGQTLIFMTMVVVMIAFAALFYFDVHKVLHVKAVSRNAGDAAALAGARWQAISLNLTGSLNIAQAQAHIDSLSRGEPYSPEAELIADLRQRIAFSGPMYGYISAQQAAKQNGVFNDPDLVSEVYSIANDFRDLNLPFTPSVGYSTAGEEVADMLELAADHGLALEVVPDYAIPRIDHLLLNPAFYDAVAGESWCWFLNNNSAFSALQNYSNFTYWDLNPGDISVLLDYFNSPYLSLKLQRLSIKATIRNIYPLPSGSTWANTIAHLHNGLENLEFNDPEAYDEFNAVWTLYNPSSWSSWESQIFQNFPNFPWDRDIRPEFDYTGAESAVVVKAQTKLLSKLPRDETELDTNLRDEMHTLQTINRSAAAKAFGSLEGGVPPNQYELVLPAFSDIRLIPINTLSGGGRQLLPDWIHFIRYILPDYLEHGPTTLQGNGNWYAVQLRTWEERAFRERGVDWLLTNSDLCQVSSGGGGGGGGGASHGH